LPAPFSALALGTRPGLSLPSVSPPLVVGDDPAARFGPDPVPALAGTL